MANAKFVVRKGRTGKFRFSLIGRNGKVIATSETYESRTSALRGVELVRRYATNAELVDQAGTRVIGGSRKQAAPKRSNQLTASEPRSSDRGSFSGRALAVRGPRRLPASAG